MSEKFNQKGKRTFKKIGAWLLGILCVALACAGVFALFGGSFGRERNPDNLIEIGEDSGYIETHNTNRGVKVDVEDDGTIKLSGKATCDYSVKVATLVLDPGTYTISGLDSVVDEFELYAQYGVDDLAISGTDNATFTLDQMQSVDIMISWSDEHNFHAFSGRTVRPVLVEGKTAGEFFAK